MLFYDKQRKEVSRYGGWPYEESDFPPYFGHSSPEPTPSAGKMRQRPQRTAWLKTLRGSLLRPTSIQLRLTTTLVETFSGPDSLSAMTVPACLATRDLRAQVWANSTADLPNQSSYRTAGENGARIHFYRWRRVPIMVEGESPRTEALEYETGSRMADMETVSLYDTSSGTWYTQTATGDVPPPRSEFCAMEALNGGNHVELYAFLPLSTSYKLKSGITDKRLPQICLWRLHKQHIRPKRRG